MKVVVCGPAPKKLSARGDLSITMMNGGEVGGTSGTVGRTFREEVRKSGLAPTLPAWDFAAIALAVTAADKGCLRKASSDGWTRQIELHVALADSSVWEPQRTRLESALNFLSGDMWTLHLHDGGLKPLSRSGRVRRRPVQGDSVSLLSGGLDSLIGALDHAAAGRKPVLVSQKAKGDSANQVRFARQIAGAASHVQLSHATCIPFKTERSERARSLFFLALGALTASSLRKASNVDLYVPENGFISYNVPLTNIRLGSLSTRTTHPYFLDTIAEIWRAVGMDVSILNPYQHVTKGEMLERCRDQAALSALAAASTSCGRFARYKYTHCGLCVPCLVRRAAFIKWGKMDSTTYARQDLGAATDHDDVRSVGVACVAARAGVDRWARNALNSQYVDDRGAAEAVVGRGLDELGSLLQAHGVL